jgi:nuclear GTP-binding protein
MYNEKPNLQEMRKQKLKPVRIEPDRKWFGNIRTIDQKTMERFNAEKMVQEKDPYSFLLRKRKLDYGFLIKEGKKKIKTHIESFAETFGPKQLRKKPKLSSCSIAEYAKRAQEAEASYDKERDSNLFEKKVEEQNRKKETTDKKMEAGQSRRIWDELYKVIDSSDILVMVLDARDPMGTMCVRAEQHIQKNSAHKHIIYVLNKTDLIPTSVTSQWVKYLSQKNPTLAYKADLAKPFGRKGLMDLLRQFEQFYKDKKNISVGFIGYPNVGKSSVINTLKKKSACRAAPIPGETKVWQYVSLTKRIYLIDCPGVVYSSENDSQTDVVLKGVVRAERIKDPDFYIEPILERVGHKVLQQIYKVDSFKTAEEFLTKLAIRTGKMRRKAEPDIETVSRMVIYDWQYGRLPHHELPPNYEKNYFKKNKTSSKSKKK